MLLEVALSGVTLGGIYALMAIGLSLQHGVARVMNLSHGELLVAAAFATLWFYSGQTFNPLGGLLFLPFAAFIFSYMIHRFLIHPLVSRGATLEAQEVNGILVTFALLFVVHGAMVVLKLGGANYSYSFMAGSVKIAGIAVATNRVMAFGLAMAITLAVYLIMAFTRAGTAMRAVAVDPVAAELAGIDTRSASAFAFALGGALVAASGVLASMVLTFNLNASVMFTMKALVAVIVGGLGNLLGAVLAGLMLGLFESGIAAWVDPGLVLAAVYAVFLLVLLVRPQGLLGRSTR
ncbi:MAG: branched-chain amino acid ABC transporter permease [Alphaproteobacteria bacterium]|nr:branched-chain amino acid ABC transporter permease [Alphaproteobacteria bacterium]